MDRHLFFFFFRPTQNSRATTKHQRTWKWKAKNRKNNEKKKKNRSVNIYPLPTGQHFRALPIFDNRHRNEWRTTSTITKFILPPLARHTHTNNKRTDLMDSSAETYNNTKEKKRNLRNWICSETRSFASQKVARSLFEIASVGWITVPSFAQMPWTTVSIEKRIVCCFSVSTVCVGGVGRGVEREWAKISVCMFVAKIDKNKKKTKKS
jgi:hypothetical protein